MIEVEEIISNLLLRQSCVIIPEFGGFVAKQMAAKIDYTKGILSPPYKSLLFNRQLINNDGLLIAEISNKQQISYDESRIIVNQLVSKWNQELSDGKRITLDKIGFLFFDQERNICFEQDKTVNLLLSSYGLTNVHFLTETDISITQHKMETQESPIEDIEPTTKKVITEKAAIELQPILPVNKEQENEKIIPIAPRKTNKWKYVAAACLIPILFYSFWIPLKTDILESKIISFHDFNPFYKKSTPEYKQQSIKDNYKGNQELPISLDEQLKRVESTEETYSYNLSEDTYVLIDMEKKGDKENPTNPEENKENDYSENQLNSTQKASIYYIVGCFSDPSNAKNLVTTLKNKGFENAKIVDVKNGLNRVSIDEANTSDEINDLIQRSKSSGYEGWVLK